MAKINKKVKKLLSEKTKMTRNKDIKEKECLDPASKLGKAPQMLLGSDDKPMRFIGMSLGATVRAGEDNQYMRLDVWDARWVEEDSIEEEKNILFNDLASEIVKRKKQLVKELK
jgi:hypothetical protein